MSTNRSTISLHVFIFLFTLTVLLAGCAGVEDVRLVQVPAASDCPVSEAVWAKPAEDAAVEGPPAEGFYFINADRSIWASAWWKDQEDDPLRVREEGVKVGWFRPEGAVLTITGQRLDAQSPPLEASVPCCYPTRFQATGLYFPEAGCWEVTARAAGSELTFVVSVAP